MDTLSALPTTIWRSNTPHSLQRRHHLSTGPSLSPTKPPTFVPSLAPSVSPTQHPTTAPSLAPTQHPFGHIDVTEEHANDGDGDDHERVEDIVLSALAVICILICVLCCCVYRNCKASKVIKRGEKPQNDQTMIKNELQQRTCDIVEIKADMMDSMYIEKNDLVTEGA
eukprot:740661_1